MEELVDVVPPIFLPIVCDGSPSYQDLNGKFLSPMEKVFLCEEILHIHSLLPPTSWGNHITENGLSLRHNIPRRSIRTWVNIYTTGGVFFDRGGRPYCVDGIGTDNVNTKLRDDRKQLNCTKKEKTHQYLVEERKATKTRRNQVCQSEDEDISPRTVKRFKTANNIVDRKPQTITDARLNALRDLRVTFLTACLLLAFSGHLPPQKKWNADATTIEVKEDQSGELMNPQPTADDNSNLISNEIHGESESDKENISDMNSQDREDE